jgi:eukaryotic-like serine/threonine-protein kinase
VKQLGTRVWGLGKLLVLIGALGATFLLFFGISVRVALRAQEVDVPPLVGRTVEEATAALTALGLGVRIDEGRRPDQRVPAGRIVTQDPPAGRQTRRERTVKLWVSSGPRMATVPALAGQIERLAQIRLRQDGLDVEAVSEIRSSSYATDAVVAQDPPAAARAPRVSLLVNRGEQAIVFVMPSLVGIDGARAVRMLQARGFRVNVAEAPVLPGTVTGTLFSIPQGTVVRQQPVAGYPVSAAEPISLEVSQ